ncbi:Maf family protein [Tomitella fengzijianii]|uniref:Nucleoside triphosphate pyrophosphatase n=1 Tax=Tomitella fengzijianii TaxID=2597660 RepID=A0A516X113_9ACTN|nr:nucleoside triphosphate pyrophosphatase [Tomitella fengzijianii]QDQ96774.1 septum formation inhibitor Maf [Tomitella fengzijianii]
MASPVAARPGDPGPDGAVAPVLFVLASASPARLSVLRAAGVEPSVRVSSVDEDAVASALPEQTGPAEVVAALARAKAVDVADGLAVQARDADAPAHTVIVGCDSMLHIDGRLQGKPHTVEAARERWATMAGRSGDLLTGHCLLRIADGRVIAEAEGVCSTTVRFGTPSQAELEAYLASREPLEVAGAFTLDGLGGWFVDSLEGDPSSVIGIGLPLVRTLLRDVGLDVAQLWAGNAR